MSPVVMKLTKADVEICKSFRSVVLQGKFDIQGAALIQAGALFRWFSDLDKRIEKTLEEPPPAAIRKDLEPDKKAKK